MVNYDHHIQKQKDGELSYQKTERWRTIISNNRKMVNYQIQKQKDGELSYPKTERW